MLALRTGSVGSGYHQVFGSSALIRVLNTQFPSNYAAVAADTFSSELGILSQSKPRLLTAWDLRQVPAGTNGGVTLLGTAAGFLGAFIIALTSVTLLPFCSVDQSASSRLLDGRKPGSECGSGWSWKEKVLLLLCITAWGGLGSLLDSALGGWFQASVVDTRTGKVVEGSGGKKVIHFAGGHIRNQLLTRRLQVLLSAPGAKKDDNASRQIESGFGLLDNNTVNFLMASIMSIGGIIVASYAWNLPLHSIV